MKYLYILYSNPNLVFCKDLEKVVSHEERVQLVYNTQGKKDI